MARIVIHECTNLISKDRINPYVRVIMNGNEKKRTHVVKRSNSPRYDVPCEVVILDKTNVFVRIEVMDGDQVLGSIGGQFVDMIRLQQSNDGWWDITNEEQTVGQIHLSAEWKPMVTTGLSDILDGHEFNSKRLLLLFFETISKAFFFLYNRTCYWCYTLYHLGSS